MLQLTHGRYCSIKIGAIMRNAKGFTLVEVLISTVIMGFAMGSILIVFTRCSLATETFENTTIAVNHIHSTFEEMRRMNNISDIVAQGNWSNWGRDNSYIDLDNNDCDTTDNSTALADDDCEKITVTYPSGQTADPLKILVSITWEDRIDAGSGRQLQAELLLTER